ncbi:alpha/beta hydrolase-fold protein [Aurantiacibacter sp. MUD11]|uniref:esterase n=1 Tax=Aurantiacibacter sp. MUD11 TaxID=3003265 RepID=UPI0022AB00CC|nr:esterase [Aurantiacibacter sp. MUD11]WAT18916.1 alpha/beta hydrolase-fold protein [Aurantiacibacter sp. MUD11]
MFGRQVALTGALIAAAWVLPASAQEQQAESCLPQGIFARPDYTSVEPLPDGRVTFRLCAPDADNVRVTSNDLDPWIPGGFGGGERGLALTHDASGLWSGTTELPIPADTYRYNFEVNGARVPDPMAVTFSRERSGINSTFEMLGEAGAFQTFHEDVPHGTVSIVQYVSSTLGAMREAYVYTPPGYMNGSESYPVLYLVHGAGDSAHSWTSVGRAHYILDNLLAEGTAEEMIIVMPFGHTPDRPGANMLANTDFGSDLIDDLIPHIDANFRTIANAEHRAMAGLSMGGAHTLNFGLPRPDLFGEVGIFSMGLGMGGPEQVSAFEEANADGLAARAASAEPVYLAMGVDDFLYGTVAPTRELFERHGIAHHYNESDGGHTWINWRRYLHDFLPRLFR